MFDKEIITRFKKITTASLADACDIVVGKRCYMDYEIAPRISDERIAGPAITVLEGLPKEKGDAPPSHAIDAIEEAEGGEVIVIVMQGGERNVALWGGLMTAGAFVKGLAGAILDAGLRDILEIRRDYGFQVFSRTVSPSTTVGRFITYDRNIPVECGGIVVNPGDLVVGDPDGVVVIPREHIEKVLEVAEDIEVKEAEQTRLIKEMKSLKQGLAKYGRI